MKDNEPVIYEVWSMCMFLIFAAESEVDVIRKTFECHVDRVSKTIILF